METSQFLLYKNHILSILTNLKFDKMIIKSFYDDLNHKN